MKRRGSTHGESSEKAVADVRAFAETADLPPGILLKLIEKWRRLQSRSSHKKSPAYSAEG
jgi:hypothetical protein